MPSDNADDTNTTTAPENLRFGFRGTIITSQASASIPVTLGLHHHGRNPGAAGYTINELSIYARSTVAAQRCFAYHSHHWPFAFLYSVAVLEYQQKAA